MRLARRVLGALVVLGALAYVLAPAPSGAARLATAGWWWRAQTGQLVTAPAPPTVPPGGLAVGRNVVADEEGTTATAIAAVRYELADDESNPILTLTVANDVGGEVATMAACHAGSGWFGTQAGAWDAKPTAACDLGSVQGSRSEDGTTWTFPVGPLALEGLVDVVIVPGSEPEPFELSFEAPTAEDLQTTTGGDFDVRPPPPRPDFFTPPGLESGAGTEPFGQPFEPALTPEEQQPQDDAPVSQQQEQAFGDSTANLVRASDDADPRPLALVVLLAGLVVGGFLMRDPLPAPRLLGPLGRHHPDRAPIAPLDSRGLGRFHRPREGAPPSLY